MAVCVGDASRRWRVSRVDDVKCVASDAAIEAAAGVAMTTEKLPMWRASMA